MSDRNNRNGLTAVPQPANPALVHRLARAMIASTPREDLERLHAARTKAAQALAHLEQARAEILSARELVPEAPSATAAVFRPGDFLDDDIGVATSVAAWLADLLTIEPEEYLDLSIRQLRRALRATPRNLAKEVEACVQEMSPETRAALAERLGVEVAS